MGNNYHCVFGGKRKRRAGGGRGSTPDLIQLKSGRRKPPSSTRKWSSLDEKTEKLKNGSVGEGNPYEVLKYPIT